MFHELVDAADMLVFKTNRSTIFYAFYNRITRLENKGCNDGGLDQTILFSSHIFI